MIEQFLDLSGFNETAHKAALDMVGHAAPLRSLELETSQAEILLHELQKPFTVVMNVRAGITPENSA